MNLAEFKHQKSSCLTHHHKWNQLNFYARKTRAFTTTKESNKKRPETKSYLNYLKEYYLILCVVIDRNMLYCDSTNQLTASAKQTENEMKVKIVPISRQSNAV